MRRRVVSSVLLGALALAFLPRCASRTEMVVAVDSDLVAGRDFDRVEVRVATAGHEELKAGAVPSPRELPLTLGIAAGDDTGANVTLEATALKDGKAVAQTKVSATMEAGMRKLLHVSLCRACPPDAQCGKSLGTALPTFESELPSTHDCAETNAADAGPDADAGGPDAQTADAGDSGPTSACNPKCPENTICETTTKQCLLGATHPRCHTPILVDTSNVFRGRICVGDGQSTDFGATCGDTRPTGADVFLLGVGTWTTRLRSKGNKTLMRSVVYGSCGLDTGAPCLEASPGFPASPPKLGSIVQIQGLKGPLKLALGANDQSACSEYELEIIKHN